MLRSQTLGRAFTMRTGCAAAVRNGAVPVPRGAGQLVWVVRDMARGRLDRTASRCLRYGQGQASAHGAGWRRGEDDQSLSGRKDSAGRVLRSGHAADRVRT
jgi:hypothetical protein